MADTAAASRRPSEAERIAKVIAAMPQNPAARPSSPSMKLTTFTIATIQRIVTG